MKPYNHKASTSNQDGQYKNKRVILDPGNFTILNTEDSRNMEAKR